LDGLHLQPEWSADIMRITQTHGPRQHDWNPVKCQTVPALLVLATSSKWGRSMRRATARTVP